MNIAKWRGVFITYSNEILRSYSTVVRYVIDKHRITTCFLRVVAPVPFPAGARVACVRCRPKLRDRLLCWTSMSLHKRVVRPHICALRRFSLMQTKTASQNDHQCKPAFRFHGPVSSCACVVQCPLCRRYESTEEWLPAASLHDNILWRSPFQPFAYAALLIMIQRKLHPKYHGKWPWRVLCPNKAVAYFAV